MQRFLGNTKLSGYECMMQALPYSHERDKEAERMRNRYKRKLNEMIDEENLSPIRQRIMKAKREMLFDTFSFKDFDHKIKFYSSYNQLAKLIGKGNIKNENLAVIYLLSSNKDLWSILTQYILQPKYEFTKNVKRMDEESYAVYQMAKQIMGQGEKIGTEEMLEPEIIKDRVLCLLINGRFLQKFGLLRFEAPKKKPKYINEVVRISRNNRYTYNGKTVRIKK